MKRIVISLFISIITIVSVISAPCANALNSSEIDSKYASLSYYFSSWNVQIDIGEDNVLHITESINAYFLQSKHGIFRSIPLYNNVRREDGTSSKNNVQISNISCSESYTQSVSNGELVLKIGDKDRTVMGDQHYTISYDYNLGKDTLNGKDEFYFNIIGTSVEAPIASCNFTLIFPKDFDDSKLGFSLGASGYIGNDSNVIWERSGNTITGSVVGILNAYEGLTARVELEDGYFSAAKTVYDKSSVISLGASTLALILCLLIYLYSKHKNIHYPVLRFYPPDNINSCEAALIKFGTISSNKITSLLIYLASKGYLTITDYDAKYHGDSPVHSQKKSSNYIIDKVKDYDGDDYAEKTFMNGLFSISDSVTTMVLKNLFYNTIRRIEKHYKSPLVHRRYFKGGFFKLKNIYTFIMIAVLVLGVFLPFTSHGGVIDFTTGFISTAYILPFVIVFGFSLSSVGVIVRIVLSIMLSGVVGFILYLSSNFYESQKLAIFTAIIVFGVLYCISPIIDNIRTPEGKKALEEVEGFEEFIKTAEKERIELLVNDNPEYFYDILPYAYALGISDEWIDKFEFLLQPPPSWYSGNSYYNVHHMAFMMSSCSSNMTYVRSSGGGSHGSHGGGGGFSGGGSGGGGGGAW